MVFTKLLLENALAVRPCNCEAVLDPLLPKVAGCIPQFSHRAKVSSFYFGSVWEFRNRNRLPFEI